MSASFAATAAILIGGHSRRMGQDKASLVWREKSLLLRVFERVAPLVDEVLLVVRPDRLAWAENLAPAGTRVITDQLQAQGPLVGIHAALSQAQNDRVMILACDMPNLQVGLLEAMLEEAIGPHAADVVVPKTTHGFEPLLAVYGVSCLEAVAKTLAAGPSRIPAFFPQVRVSIWSEEKLRSFDSELLSLLNFNNPEDLNSSPDPV